MVPSNERDVVSQRYLPAICLGRLVRLGIFCLVLTGSREVIAQIDIQRGEMAGYLHAPTEKVAESYDAGFSMYVAAWPLLKSYPGSRFQSGLFGTWMFAKKDEGFTEKIYSDIEGGLGWWRDTRFATETPKFIMGGVARNFVEWANGPGAGKGRDWSKPQGKYAVIQLSPNVLWPPDGLSMQQGTCGELVGYGYLALPLADEKKVTSGKEVPTGNQCWTLFLNTKNLKGPVAFFAPYFWSKPTLDDPKVVGMFLDSRPADPNRALQMETQHIPSAQATDSKGVTYARVAPTLFPSNNQRESLLVHQVTSYNRSALWDSVSAWLAGGNVATGEIDQNSLVVHKFRQQGAAGWKIYSDGTTKEEKDGVKWNAFATRSVSDTTFGYKWNSQWVKEEQQAGQTVVRLPEYFKLVNAGEKAMEWTPVSAAEVPAETGLAEVDFGWKRPAEIEPYETPQEADSSWKKPGPAAGPFKAVVGDGSTVTYYWYRFADQPSMLNADLTDEEREKMQRRIEMLHRSWTKEREYLPPPAVGELASVDPALVVSPPKGLEIGYVPIVTFQEKSN